MKKIFYVMLAAVALSSMTACGSKAAKDAETDADIEAMKAINKANAAMMKSSSNDADFNEAVDQYSDAVDKALDEANQ